MTKQVSDPDSLQFVLEHAARLRAQFSELDEDAIIEADGRDVVLLADEIERLQQLIQVADGVGNKAAAEIKRLQAEVAQLRTVPFPRINTLVVGTFEDWSKSSPDEPLVPSSKE
jgi:hypothetical protein